MFSFSLSTKQRRLFSSRLLRWYHHYGRTLPWRSTHNPYHILVAELMLQQTQVQTVIPRYQLWLKRFPTIQTLAKASAAEVLREWSGLGYNRRALALHQIAKTVVADYHGKFPTSISELKRFKGIGEYTAHAIASFAWQQSVPLVDTNIKRVLGRVFLGYQQLEQLRHDAGVFWTLSQQIVEHTTQPYDFNQGMMDFGATVCTAKKPSCLTCPMQTICRSYPKILSAQPDQLRVQPKRLEPQYFGQPRRIWRGRILAFLQTRPKGATVSAIGRHLHADWDTKNTSWLNSVLDTLIKDKMIMRIDQQIKLYED